MGLPQLRPPRSWSLSWARCCLGDRLEIGAALEAMPLIWATESRMLKAEQRVLFSGAQRSAAAADLICPNSDQRRGLAAGQS